MGHVQEEKDPSPVRTWIKKARFGLQEGERGVGLQVGGEKDRARARSRKKRSPSAQKDGPCTKRGGGGQLGNLQNQREGGRFSLAISESCPGKGTNGGYLRIGVAEKKKPECKKKKKKEDGKGTRITGTRSGRRGRRKKKLDREWVSRSVLAKKKERVRGRRPRGARRRPAVVHPGKGGKARLPLKGRHRCERHREPNAKKNARLQPTDQ